ncbi:MAG: hypothetical protein ACR2OH_11540, partial [Microthrixaceae bacterium]
MARLVHWLASGDGKFQEGIVGAMGMRGRIGVALVAVALLGGLLASDAGADPVVENPGPVQIKPDSSSMTLRGLFVNLAPSALAECENYIDDDGDTAFDTADPQCVAGDDAPASLDNSEVAPGYQPKEPLELNGEVDADGNLTIPTEGVKFPTAYIGVNLNGVYGVVTVKIVPTDDAVGHVDPVARTASLRVQLKIQLSGTIGLITLAPNCGIGTDEAPLDILFSGIYSDSFGIANLANNTFDVPGARNCGYVFNNPVSQYINQAVGIPSPAGNNSAQLNGRLDPKPVKPGTATTTTVPTTTVPTTTLPPTTTTTSTSTTTTTTVPPTTTTSTTTTVPPTTTTTTSPRVDETSDQVSVEIRGGTEYSASGPTTSGRLSIWGPGKRKTASVSASLDGPDGGSARIGSRIRPI